jgi:hypothetical protein
MTRDVPGGTASGGEPRALPAPYSCRFGCNIHGKEKVFGTQNVPLCRDPTNIHGKEVVWFCHSNSFVPLRLIFVSIQGRWISRTVIYQRC